MRVPGLNGFLGAPAWLEGIACVWLPQLPLRIELRQHPEWDGLPLVLGAAPGERRLVQRCSPEAERAGVRPGLSLREVHALCPEAVILQPDPVRLATARQEILEQLQEVSPAVEPGEDCFYLDLHGLREVYHGDPRLLEEAIRAAVAPVLLPRIGIAAGKFSALLAARTASPAGLRLVPAQETAAFLAPLPLRWFHEPCGSLPFPVTLLQRLDLLGLRRIADLAALPFGAVQAEFGAAGARAWRLASGQDDERIIPHRFAPVVRVELNLDDPIASVDAVLAALNQLLSRAFADLALATRSARTVQISALLANGSSWTRRFAFKEALNGRDPAYRALKSRIELPNFLPTSAIETLSLELTGFGGEAAKQPGMFTSQARPWEPIAEVAWQLRARYGAALLYHAVEVEPWSRIPERRWALVPVRGE